MPSIEEPRAVQGWQTEIKSIALARSGPGRRPQARQAVLRYLDCAQTGKTTYATLIMDASAPPTCGMPFASSQPIMLL
jgi:hypothetical protein